LEGNNIDADTYLYASIACWVICAIVALVILIFWSSIKIGIAVIKASARFI